MIGCLENWELEKTDKSRIMKTPDWCIITFLVPPQISNKFFLIFSLLQALHNPEIEQSYPTLGNEITFFFEYIQQILP